MKTMRTFFLVFLGCLVVLPIFSSSREAPKNVEAAREELKTKMKETSVKQEEIRKKEQEIEEKKKNRDENGQKKAEEQLIALDREMQNALDAKIKAANDVLYFKPEDGTAIGVKETAAETKKVIDAQIKKLEQQLKSEGTSTVTPIQDNNLSLGERLSKNLQVWRDTTLAKVHESLGNYEKAKKLRDGIAQLYAELKRPLKAEQNFLVADRLSLKLGQTPRRIAESLDFLNNYLERLDRINKNETIDLAKSKIADDKDKIKKTAAQAREKALDPKALDELLYSIITVRDQLSRVKLANESEKANFKKIDALIEDALVSLEAKEQQFKARTDAEIKVATQEQEKAVAKLVTSSALEEFKKNRDILLGSDNGLGLLAKNAVGIERNENFKKVNRFLHDVQQIDLNLISSDAALLIGTLLEDTYTKIEGNYYDFIKNSETFKTLSSSEQNKMWDILDAQVVFKDTAKEILNRKREKLRNPRFDKSQSQKKYNDIVQKEEKNAKPLSAQEIESAEIEISKVIETMNKSLETPQDKGSIEVLAKEESKLIDATKSLLEKTAKVDPSQNALILLENVEAALNDIREKINSITKTNDLSSVALTTVATVKLTNDALAREISVQAVQDKNDLTHSVDGQAVEFDVMNRRDAKVLRKEEIVRGPSAPPPPPYVEVVRSEAKNVQQSGESKSWNDIINAGNRILLKPVSERRLPDPIIEKEANIAFSIEEAMKSRRIAIEDSSSDEDEPWTEGY